MPDTLEAATMPKVDVKGGVIAYVNVDGALEAAKFYEKAFGATVAGIYPPDEQGRSMHVHLYINGGSFMMSDFYPEHGLGKVEPQGYTLMLPIEHDIENHFQRAADAGCEVMTPVQKMFWGDTYGELKDPFGIRWAMNQQAD